MNDKELIDLGKSVAIRRSKSYLIVGIVLPIIGVVALIGAIFGVESENRVSAIIGCVGLAIIGIVFIIASFVSKNKIIDDNKMLELGKKERDRENAKAELEQELKADFLFDKEYINESNKNKVWINTTTKDIQFLFLDGKKRGIGWKKCRKTKVMNINLLTDIELLHSVEEEKKYSASSFHGDYFGSGNMTVSTNNYHYYAIELKFNDLDYPFVKLYFGSNDNQASTVYETIKLLKNDKE